MGKGKCNGVAANKSRTLACLPFRLLRFWELSDAGSRGVGESILQAVLVKVEADVLHKQDTAGATLPCKMETSELQKWTTTGNEVHNG